MHSSDDLDGFAKEIELVLRQKLPLRHKMARIAADAEFCLRSDNKAGFDEIARTLGNLQVSGWEFGIELMAIVTPENRTKLFVWLDSIPDQAIRFNGTAGSLGQLMAADPEIGVEMAGELNKELLSMRDLNDVLTLKEAAWLTAGRLLIEDGSKTNATSSALSALTNDNKLLASLAEGVAGAAAKAVNAGKDITLLEATIAGLPNELRSSSLERIVAHLGVINDDGVDSASFLLGILGKYPDVSSDAFHKLGTKLNSETFFSDYVAQKQEFSKRDLALIKGWAFQRPESAFQKAIDSRPELASTVFEAWIESDSISASSKLAQMENGATKTECVSRLCEYLVSKNALDEANGWLEVLPEVERSRIQALINMRGE